MCLSSDFAMLSSNHVIVTSSQETSSPSLPQTVVILPPGTTFQLNPQSSLSPVPIHPSSHRPLPLRHVLPKPLASATFQRAPTPSPSPPSKSNSSLLPSRGSSISSVKFCFPDTKKSPLVQSDLNKFPSTSQRVNSDQRNFQFASSTSKLSPRESNPLSFTHPSSHVVPTSEPLPIPCTVPQVPKLSTRMILKKFLSCKRKRTSHGKPWRSQVTTLVRRSIT